MTEIAETSPDVADDAGNDSFLRDGIRIFCRNRMAMAGLIMVGCLVFVAASLASFFILDRLVTPESLAPICGTGPEACLSRSLGQLAPGRCHS